MEQLVKRKTFEEIEDIIEMITIRWDLYKGIDFEKCLNNIKIVDKDGYRIKEDKLRKHFDKIRKNIEKDTYFRNKDKIKKTEDVFTYIWIWLRFVASKSYYNDDSNIKNYYWDISKVIKSVYDDFYKEQVANLGKEKVDQILTQIKAPIQRIPNFTIGDYVEKEKVENFKEIIKLFINEGFIRIVDNKKVWKVVYNRRDRSNKHTKTSFAYWCYVLTKNKFFKYNDVPWKEISPDFGFFRDSNLSETLSQLKKNGFDKNTMCKSINALLIPKNIIPPKN